MASQGASATSDLIDLVISTATSVVYPADDALLSTLQARFRSDQPYTRLSPSRLVVLNPYRALANLNDSSANDYARKTYGDVRWEQQGAPHPLDALPPHPYELAARLYLTMRREKRSQAVIYGGVSDSGKTFTSKLLTAQILRLSSSANKREMKLAEQVRALETLLNSFGAAKTKLNGNATRHSRYLELHFTTEGRLGAAKVLTFGLDKRRVARITQEERTFHVFYQLLAGATHEERDQFKLDDVTSYTLLAQSGCYRLPGGPSSDDSIAMDELRAAMKLLGFKQRHMSSIFTMVSAILLLGNIQFSDHNGHDASFESAHILNRAELEDAAELLGVEAEDLERALTTRSRFVRKELITSLLNAEAARDQRDSLMSDLYATLFAFVVESANHKLSPSSEDAFPYQIVQLDGSGYQARGGSSIGGAPPASTPQNTYDEFTGNFIAELLHNWSTHRAFDDSAPANAALKSDGVPLHQVVTGDNSACIELLRGGLLSTGADRKPTGMLGVLDKSMSNVRTGKAGEEDDTALLNEFDGFRVHGSYISSAAATEAGPSIKAFGIHHYLGTCSYSAEHFVQRDLDLFDSSFVQLLRQSSSSFTAKLFAGPSLATETHPLDQNTIVTAQVSARPLRRPSPLAPGADVDTLLDPFKVYSVTRQLNATVSELLAGIDENARVWDVTCMRPNDISQPNSFDARRVKSQIRSFLLPDLVARKRTDLVISFGQEEFCTEFAHSIGPAAAAAGVESASAHEKIQALAIASAWRDGVDFALGKQRVHLAYAPWRRLDDRIRATEPADPPFDGSGLVGLRSGDDDASMLNSPSYPPGAGVRGYSGGDLGETKAGLESADNLLDRPYGANPFQTPASERRAESINGWGSDWGKGAYGDTAPGMTGALEKHGNLDAQAIDAIEEVPTTSLRRWWVAFSWILTFWIPSFMLSYFGGMKRPDVRQAWREKVAICTLIFLLCGTILFYILVFGKLLCPDQNKAWNTNQLGGHTGDNDFYVAVAGKVYDISKFWQNQHSDLVSQSMNKEDTKKLAGLDLTPYFPVPLSVGCPGLVTNVNFALTINQNLTGTVPQAMHTSGSLQPDKSSKLAQQNWYPNRFVPFLRRYYKGYFVYSKKALQADAEWRQWAYVDDKIYDLTNYITTVQLAASQSALANFMDSSIVSLFQGQSGSDITSDFKLAMAAFNGTTAAAHQNCLDNVFYAGKIDFRDTARCQVNNYLLLSFSILLVVTMLAKFLAALQLSPKRNPEQQDKFVICQVPCYTEGEEELRRTIDSLAGLHYDDKRKLIFVICDGMIVGSGNERPTPRIVLDILGVDPKIDPEPLMFKSIAEGSRQLNYGKVYSGLYEFEGHVVPYIVVVKCGRPSERSRPGNRGKRDTQVLLMRYLNRVHFDAPMAPLELEIYHQMKNVIGIDPAFYEYILMVDADTSVEEDSLNRLIAVAADDSRVIALCGETKLTNEESSWWTMIQVYEYFISHHLAKAFESLFGSVTCLPGCFSVYRIRSADKGRPLFISNRIIDDYSENRIDTLHKKNLLSLGEDRYLTTLILKHFPSFRTKFTPDAQAHTSAPDRWGILLSQRRRWINSTIHNLAELVLMPELCGFCLFSMRFVVFIDLLGTLILPATVVYLVYLIVVVASGDSSFPLISIIMIAATYGLQAIVFLVKRQWQYIGWMLIYILAYPIYSFFLPIYSFWHMDDFSWGNTRIVVGEKGNKKIVAGTDDDPYDDSMIPLKKFSDYQREVWEQPAASRAASMRSGMTGPSMGPFSNHHAVAGSQSYIPRASHSQYAGSAAGSDYGGDYFQNTNVIEPRGTHSRSGSGAMSLGPSRMPSMAFGTPSGGSPGMMPTQPGMSSMYGMPSQSMGSMYGLPLAPNMSMYGMPSPGFPGMGVPGMGHSYSPAGSEIGLDGGAAYGHMQQSSQSLNRNSMMPLQPQTTGMSAGGWGLAAPGGLSGDKRMSTMTTLSSANPFGSASAVAGMSALVSSDKLNPTDEDLTNAVRRYLAAQPNLMNVTKRQVREAVIASFPNAPLGEKEKKTFINKAIDDTLSGA